MPDLFDIGQPDTPDWFVAGKSTPATHVANVRAGRHPMGLPLLENPGDRRCGNCAHLRRISLGSTYIKCGRCMTGGPATDVRVKWPACIEYQNEGTLI